MRASTFVLGCIVVVCGLYFFSFMRNPMFEPRANAEPPPAAEAPPPLTDRLDRVDEKLDQLGFKIEQLSNTKYDEYESSIKTLAKAMNTQIGHLEVIQNQLREQHDAPWKADPQSTWNRDKTSWSNASQTTQPAANSAAANEPVFYQGYWWQKGLDGTNYYQADRDSLVKFVSHVGYHVTGRPVPGDVFAGQCASGQCGVSVSQVSYGAVSSAADVSVQSYGQPVSVQVGYGGAGYGAGKGKGGVGILGGIGRALVGTRKGTKSVVAVPVPQAYSVAQYQPAFYTAPVGVFPSAQQPSLQSPSLPSKQMPPLPSKSAPTAAPTFYVPQQQFAPQRFQANSFAFAPGRR